MSATSNKINLGVSISRALDAAAPDKPSWRAGYAAFWNELPLGSIGQALSKALDAAAPDSETWLAGEATFGEGLSGTWKDHSILSGDSVKEFGKKGKSAFVEGFGSRRKH